jgi:hypothetical protein
MSSIKNQIRSFTASATKNEVTNYFVFLGGISGGTNTTVDETDISLLSRITKDEVATVVPRVNWTNGIEYTPYTVTETDVSKSYVLNTDNSMVYLCVGKNQPTGLIGNQAYPSAVSPTHTVGAVTYSDGYMWQALYKVDQEVSNFLNSTVMPVNSLYDYRQDNLAGTFATKYDSLCTSKGSTGSCFFYYNEASTDPVSGITYEKGDRVLGFPETNWFCSTCHETGEKFGYKSYHIDVVNKQSEIDRNPLDEVSQDYLNGYLNPNGKDYIQQGNFSYATELNHSIFSLHLDVSNLSLNDRKVRTQNPTIVVLDARGFGATARITTYYDIVTNSFIANGIELLTVGQDYVNPQFRIDDAFNTNLQKAIKAVVIDPPYIADPSIILPTPRVSIVKKISNNDLSNTFATNQRVFSKVGIVDNVLLSDNTNAATGLISGQKVEYRATTELTLSTTGFLPIVPNISVGDVSVVEEAGDSVLITTTDDTVLTDADYNSKLVSIVDNGDDTYTLEIASADELTFDVLTTADTITIDDVEYNIDDIDIPQVRVDLVDYVASRVLDTPLNIAEATSKQNSVTINFLI